MSKIFMWAEVHRPKSLDECNLEFLSDGDRALIRHVAITGESPNLLLYGSPGTGKTTVLRLLYAATLKYDIAKLVAEKLTGHRNEPWLIHSKPRTDGTRWGRATLKAIAFCDQADLIPPEDLESARSSLQSVEPNSTAVLTCADPERLPGWLTSRFIQIRFGSAPLRQRDAHFASIVRRCQNILAAEEVPAVPDQELMEIVKLRYSDQRQIVNELQRRYQVRARRRAPEEHVLDYGTPKEFEDPRAFEMHIAAAIEKELLGNGPPQLLKHIPKNRQIDGVPVSDEEWNLRAWHHPSTRAQVIKEQKEWLENLRKAKTTEPQESAATDNGPSEPGETRSPAPKKPSNTIH
jgi:hypothetical protein